MFIMLNKFIYTYAIVSRNNIKVCTFLLIKYKYWGAKNQNSQHWVFRLRLSLSRAKDSSTIQILGRAITQITQNSLYRSIMVDINN